MMNLPSPKSIKYHSPRCSIAHSDEIIWRIGSRNDLEKEEQTKQFPIELESFFPNAAACTPYQEQLCRQEEYLGAIEIDPQILIQKWQDARKYLWQELPLETKPLRQWLKQIQPPCALSTKEIQKFWKQNKATLPFKLKDCNLRKILDTPIQIQLHQGYTHNALIPRRIRERGFICWRYASDKGLRGVDCAPYLSPEGQPLDIQLHILKWAWKNDPIKLAETLFAMNLVTSIPQTAELQIKKHHPAISKAQLLRILGVQEGIGRSTLIAKALYRAKKLNIGGIPIELETAPPLSPIKDSEFFLPRKRRPTELFSRWNQGCQLDEEGLYSVTPERHALRIAKQAQHPVIVDAFCGGGGNTIAFARQKHVQKVISFEIDPARMQMARNNASIYGISDKISFHQKSSLQNPPAAPFVFLDPPWEWSVEKLDALRKQFQKKYPHGMMKLPISFPFPQDATCQFYLTEENYPSFALLQW